MHYKEALKILKDWLGDKVSFYKLEEHQFIEETPLLRKWEESRFYQEEYSAIVLCSVNWEGEIVGLKIGSVLHRFDHNIKPLSLITGLQTLDLSNNRVEDISFLSSMTSLQNLNLSNNQVEDISFLSSMTSLQNLNLSNNQVEDISFLPSMTGLQSLNLSNIPVEMTGIIPKDRGQICMHLRV